MLMHMLMNQMHIHNAPNGSTAHSDRQEELSLYADVTDVTDVMC